MTREQATNAWNVFETIVAGREPASFVYEDDVVVAFMDIRPVNRGHVLVIPRKVMRDLAELDDDTAARLFVVARRIAAAIRRTDIRCEGINLFLADGEAAGQEVFHVHLHVVPRYAGDGFGHRYGPDYGKPVARQDLDAVAAAIKAAIAA
jgi:diadenosine tetraphosphate (Ap4A) HIT family hydrolase